MIRPKALDIGRVVIYRMAHTDEEEEGTITSYNDQYVFVRYGKDTGSKATRREDLNWAHPTSEELINAG